MSARMIMKNDYSKRSMPLNWGVSKSLTTSNKANKLETIFSNGKLIQEIDFETVRANAAL